jgi:alkylated DNA repair dioxygenase AlkB
MTRTTESAPPGLVYVDGLLDDEEEREALGFLERIDYRTVEMRGQVARRTVRHYGLDYDYERWRLRPTDPLPEELEWLRARCARLVGVEPRELAQTLVTRYPPGATIGWHRDAPMFGVVVGVSLGSACRMRFQRTVAGERSVREVVLEPGSAYALTGQARWSWQHSIRPTPALRYSVTFRTLRQPPQTRAETA